jgi:acyl-CoA synthetase (AMP-forming)/AMP-acid ligase II
MQGYHKHPAETAKAMTADGWLRTGDLDGSFFVTGPLKEPSGAARTSRPKSVIRRFSHAE